MNRALDFDKLAQHQSVVVARTIAIWYLTAMAILTILTHGSLLISISFRAYAYLALAALVVTCLWLTRNGIREVRKSQIPDVLPLLLVLLAGGLAAWITTLSQPIRQFGTPSLDDYYYLANPVCYLQNPGTALSLQMHDYYSGQVPFISAAFYVAEAYQYIQAAFAYLLKVNFVGFSYLFASSVGGFMFPLALYLVLTRFSDSTLSASVGVLGTLLLVLLLGESERTPGTWIFSRVFQGKSILVSSGLLWLTHFSLELFTHRRFGNWANLTCTVITLCGMSTTSIMLLPVMAAILFVSFYFVVRKNLLPAGHLLNAALTYGASFGYLVAFGAYVQVVDSAGAAAYVGQGYPQTLLGVEQAFFQDALFPTTLLFLVSFSVAAILLTGGAVRRFVAGVLFLPFLILNPWVSALLIGVFHAIYFRMFYILPLFPVMGLTISQLFNYSLTLQKQMRVAAWSGALLLAILLFVYLPTSVKLRLHGFQYNFYSGINSRIAQQLINETPKGLMLAPYPLSSVVFTFDPAYPQMYVRPDISDLFLWKQGRLDEAALRAQTAHFLLGDQPDDGAENYKAFAALVRTYPQIESIVINEQTLLSNPAIGPFLQQRRFLHKIWVQGFVVFSK